MPLFELEIRQTQRVYVTVEADDEDHARRLYDLTRFGTSELGRVNNGDVTDEELLAVTPMDVP